MCISQYLKEIFNKTFCLSLCFSYMRHAFGLGEHYNSVEPLVEVANEEEGWRSMGWMDEWMDRRHWPFHCWVFSCLTRYLIEEIHTLGVDGEEDPPRNKQTNKEQKERFSKETSHPTRQRMRKYFMSSSCSSEHLRSMSGQCWCMLAWCLPLLQYIEIMFSSKEALTECLNELSELCHFFNQQMWDLDTCDAHFINGIRLNGMLNLSDIHLWMTRLHKKYTEVFVWLNKNVFMNSTSFKHLFLNIQLLES